MWDLSHLDEECVPYDSCPSGHTGVGGGMYVHDEDLAEVSVSRRENGDRPIECERCDARYIAGRGWVTS